MPLRALAPGGLDRFPPRALRSWPGIGETRALDVAEVRFRHPRGGPPLYLRDVPGIGERTERAVREWLEAGPTPPAVEALRGGSGARRGPLAP